MSKDIPRIDTTPPAKTHRRKASFASPIDIKPRSATMRRMSLSSTPQSAPSGMIRSSTMDTILERPQLSLAGLITGVMLTGIAISITLDTSLDTSALSSLTTPIRTAYFARKSNIFNQWFVKKSWGWTSLIYIIHLFTAPPTSLSRTTRHTSRLQRLVAFIIASSLWLGFTTWFFGAGLGDRIIALSGGTCAVPLPLEWDIDPEILQPLLPSNFPTLLTSSSPNTFQQSAISTIYDSNSNNDEEPIQVEKKQLYLPLHPSFCHHQLPLTPKTHPELFSLLSQTSISFPVARETNTLHPSNDHPPLQFAKPRWSNGFDISGHSFLLTLAALVLIREIAPSWRGDAVRDSNDGWIRLIHMISTVAGSALLGLWVWMLFITSIYFHNPPEKITGLVAGLTGAALVNILTPSFLFTSTPSSHERFPINGISSRPSSQSLDDENAARRGETVDEGTLVPVDTDTTVHGESSAIETSVGELGAIATRRIVTHHDEEPKQPEESVADHPKSE